MRLRTILIGVAMLAMAFVGATLAMQVLWPAAEGGRRPALCGGSAASARQPHLDHRCADRDRARRHSRIAGGDGAARSQRQARQRRIQGPVQRRDRLDGEPRSARRVRQAGRDRRLDRAHRLAARDRPAGDKRGGRSRRRDQRGAGPRSRAQRREARGPHPRPAHRYPRQCRGDLAAAADAGMAARTQPHDAVLDRRRQHDHRRRAPERGKRGAAADGTAGQRAGRALAGAAAQRSVPGAGGAPRMGQALPLDRDRRRRRRPAEPVARASSHPRDRRAAAGRCRGRHAAGRGRGRDAHRPRRKPSRNARSRRRSRSCRRASRAASTSRCRSTCRSPRSTA